MEAAIKSSVNNSTVSAYDATLPENIVLFAGYTPTIGECAAPVSTSVCNSCTGLSDLCLGTNPATCTSRSVHPALLLNIDFSVDTIPTGGKVLIQLVNGSTTVDVTGDFTLTTSTPVANQTVSASIEWSKICSRASAGTTCDQLPRGFQSTLNVGISSDAGGTVHASGGVQKFTIRFTYAPAVSTLVTTCGSSDPFCAFKVAPGDAKVYVEETSRGMTGPGDDDSGVKYSALRIYSAKYTGTPNFCSIPIGASAQFTDLPVAAKTEATSTLTSNFASSLENEVSYMFNIATVDEATVVSGFMSPTSLVEGVHTAKPGKVVGLLDSKSCFVATAAYGSEMAPQVEKLRQFRDQFLLSFDLGKKFVSLYYQISPPIAQFISGHESLRFFTRLLLWPLIFFAELSSAIGVAPALLLLFGALGLLGFGIHRFRQRIGEA